MTKPNFLYIGPPRAGSTWLYHVLSHHPQVFLARAKELHYFDKYYSLGPKWYLKHFREATYAHRVIGEISHDYLYSAEACKRIAEDLGGIRLMVCLREPAERAYSDYLYTVKQGYIRSRFEESIKSTPAILEHGLYARYLSLYSRQFGKGALLITRFDDLRRDPGGYYKSVCEKLGINDSVSTPNLVDKILVAAAPRNQLLARAAKSAAMRMRQYGLADTIARIKSQKWLQRALYKRFKSDGFLTLNNSVRHSLKHYYTQDVLQLDREFMPGIARVWGYE